jgi:hypothetical protein
MIHPSGTFEYEAEFTKDGFSDSDIVLYGSDLSGGNIDRLVGHNPMIRFWRDRIVLVASEKPNSIVRNVSFAIGDAVPLSARPGDRLYLVRTGSGGIGLSLLRQERLVLATGAVTAVPLGRDIQSIRCPRITNSWNDPLLDTWLEFRIGDEQLILREREATEIGGYHIYIEHGWEDGVPGTDECVSVSVLDNPSMMIAAMRSAILVANGDLKTTRWDCTEHFTAL